MGKRGSNWTLEQDELLLKHYPDCTADELVELLGRTTASIYGRASKLEIKKSAEFWASQKCGLIKEIAIGTEYVDRSGYLMRKINNDLPYSQRWKPVHIILWEEHHGPVPKGCLVAFKDGDKKNICIENLKLMSRREMLDENSIHRYPPEVVSTILLHASLERKIKRRLKDAKDT